jgi:chemotaxis response regulator CheB
MKEDVLPFFIHDMQSALSVEVISTPTIVDFKYPSIIVCSHSSIIQKDGKNYNIKTSLEGEYYTPDINKFFSSFANYTENFDVDVFILTGIGHDGVDGAKLLKSKGAKIYAQDEKSSPVYGMPKAAYESGIVDKVMSLDELKKYFKSL